MPHCSQFVSKNAGELETQKHCPSLFVIQCPFLTNSINELTVQGDRNVL